MIIGSSPRASWRTLGGLRIKVEGTSSQFIAFVGGVKEITGFLGDTE
jgi:hypothetical protein